MEKLSIFLLLLILVNLTRSEIPEDSLTTNSPSQKLNGDAVTENVDVVEGSTITDDEEEPLTSEAPSELGTSTLVDNESENNVEDSTQTDTPITSTESIIDSTTNQIECVCDCFANGNQVTVGCSTLSPKEPETETIENSSNNDSTLPNAENTTPGLVEENSTNSNNIETTSELNAEANTSTQSVSDTQTPGPICSTPGIQAHELNCEQYQDCSLEGSQDGSFHLITKSCPEKQAFNIELNRCSRDISSCSLDIQCLVKGTIADPTSNSSYYLCEPRLVGLGFHIFHVNCGSHEIFYPNLGKCYVDLSNMPIYNWNQVRDIDIIKAELKLIKDEYKLKLKQEKDRKKAEKKLQKEAKKKAKQEATSFVCVNEGNFASQIGDNFYITCITKKDKFKAYSMQCGLGETFDPVISICIYSSVNGTRSINDDDSSNSVADDD